MKVLKSKKSFIGKKILVVPDGHISETDDLLRFDALINYIKKNKKNIGAVVFIGDLISNDCLSHFDKNKKKLMEGRRYKKQIDKMNEFLNKYLLEVKLPTFYVAGNHEYRIDSHLEVNPTFDGILNIPVILDLEKRGITWVPYKTYLEIDNILFTHIPIGGNGKPMGGENLEKKILRSFQKSIVYGHTHRLITDHIRRFGGEVIRALNIGCFFEEAHDYEEGSVENHWKGIVLISPSGDGDFDFETKSLKNLLGEYKNERNTKSKYINKSS